MMSHGHVSSRHAVAIWLFLVVASLAVAWLGEHRSVFAEWTVAVVCVVALVKARAIILYYMDIKYAPLQLRLPFEAWALASTVIILGFWYAS